ncbi:MAG: retropepsin-like aspartic protease [Bryobacteraceae bacterium]
MVIRSTIWIPWLLAASAFGASDGTRITLRQGFPFIDVNINGKGPFHMLVDTGADASLLTPKAAERAGLSFDHRVILSTVAGERIVKGASANRIEVDGAVESGLAILALELPTVRAIARDADGVLGQSFLSREAYLLDYEQKRLWLGDAATQQATRLSHAVTATYKKGRTVIPVALDRDGGTWQMALDSGSTNLIVDCSARCPRAWGVERDSRLVTHAGERAVLRGNLRQVALGDSTMPYTEAVLLEGTPPPGWDEGLLPTRWFSAFYVNAGVMRFETAR